MYSNNLSVNTEELKEMADILRPIVKYAKKQNKERTFLQNIIFTIRTNSDGEQHLKAAAVSGAQCLEYTFSASPMALNDCVFVLTSDQIEKIVKSFCDIDDCETVSLNIYCDDNGGGCYTGHLEAVSNIADSAVIKVPVSATENTANPFWDALGCANYKVILDGASLLNGFSFAFNSSVLKPLFDGVDKHGDTKLIFKSNADSNTFHVSSIDGIIEGVVMATTSPAVAV